MLHDTRPTFRTYSLLGIAGALAVVLLLTTGPGATPAMARWQSPPPDVMTLAGVAYDFRKSHPDFGLNSPADAGHTTGSVAPALDVTGHPAYTGAGQHVATEWYDKDGNPIMPYAGPGLPGGHFDVDVYDAPSTQELYHEHEFDDKFDVTYIDVPNDPKLLYNAITGGMTDNLRLEFLNTHNGGGGTFLFNAGSGPQTGTTADGFTATFDPAALTDLKVYFIALPFLRATKPGISQDDPVDRDDAFHIRMYNDVTNEMVYEIAVYHHFKKNEVIAPPPNQNDSCGNPIVDTPGSYAGLGTGDITDGTTFDQWYRNVLGTNLSVAKSISLTRNAAGVYEYLTDSFFPIDDQLLGNEGEAHNNNFTYAISATFTYNQCTGQFFEFASNDDAWVFIDDQMVIDLGGVAATEPQYVALDRLGLVDGQTYSFKFFFAQRRDAGNSVFNMRLNFPMNATAQPVVSMGYD